MHMGFEYETFENWKLAVEDLLQTSYEIVSDNRANMPC